MHRDIVDAQWWDLFKGAGLRLTFRWRVTEHLPSHVTLSDRPVRMKWVFAAPRFGITWELWAGRIVSLSRENIWTLSEDGWVEPVVDYRFNSREGRDVIRLVAQHPELEERQPLWVKLTMGIGLIAATFIAGYGLVLLALRIARNDSGMGSFDT